MKPLWWLSFAGEHETMCVISPGETFMEAYFAACAAGARMPAEVLGICIPSDFPLNGCPQLRLMPQPQLEEYFNDLIRT